MPGPSNTARPVRCSTIGMPTASRIECTGRSPVDVPSMFNESIPTQATSAATSASADDGREVRMALHVRLGAEVDGVVGAHEHRVPGEPGEVIGCQIDGGDAA